MNRYERARIREYISHHDIKADLVKPSVLRNVNWQIKACRYKALILKTTRPALHLHADGGKITVRAK